MSNKRRKLHSGSQPSRQSSGSKSATPKQGSDTTKPWYKSVSTWLVITIATGVIGGATGVIGGKLGDAATAQGQPSGPPVLVSQVFAGPGDAGLSYALPDVHHLSSAQLTSLATSGKTSNLSQFDSFITLNHGAPADGTGTAVVQLTLRGNRSHPVLVTGMQVVKQCGPPMRGTLFYSPSAGQPDNAMIGFDLDKAIPQADEITGSGALGPSYFLLQHISLNDPEDTQGVSVEATTTGSCTFHLVMQVLDGATTTYETVNDSTTIGSGPPFSITDMVDTGAYGLVYVGGVVSAKCDDAWTRVDSTFSTSQSPMSIVCNRT